MATRRPTPPISRRSFLAGALVAGTSVVAACTRPPAAQATVVREEIRYGEELNQSGDLSIPQLAGTRPVVVLIHGGYWKVGFDRDELDELAGSLAQAGFAVWNIDYRRLGEGGGWTATFTDVATAIDHLQVLARTHPIDVNRVGVMGHSAGGQLALWAAARSALHPDQPGASPLVRPRGAVSLAGVVDLAMAVEHGSGPNARELHDAVIQLLGGTPAQQAPRYRVASPIERLPIGVPQLLVHGAKDQQVPVEQSRAYLNAAARTSDQARLIELPNADHAGVILSDKPGWAEVLTWLRTNVGDPAQA